MAQGNVIKLAGEFSDDALPRYYPNDGSLTKGHKFMFDMKNLITYPAQAAQVGSTTLLKNLVTGGPDAQVVGSTYMTYTAGGGLKLTQANGGVDMGAGNYDIGALGNINFVYGAWVMFPTGAEENTTSFQTILGKSISTAAGNIQTLIDSGLSGKRPRGSAGNASTVQFSSKTTDISLGVVHHLACVVENNTVQLYVDGIAQGAPTAIAGPLASPAVNWRACYSWAKGTIYRWYLESLTDSGRTGAAAVADEYAKNTGRYS